MGVALSSQATDWREGRRLRAWELVQSGWSQKKVAEALGVTPGAVSQWMRRVREGSGPEALRRRKAPGGRPRLTPEQHAKLLELLLEGAEAHGFKGELWTRKRVAMLISREFGVRYHPGHVSKLLKDLGWSSQKPERRASQRDEAAIEQWVRERWPEIKKGR